MQTIYLDISNKGVIPTIYAKQGDVGRKFEVVLTDSGLPYIPASGSAFSAWYSGSSGMGNYTDIGGKSAFSVSGNKVTVELITQMLQVGGDGIFCLVLNNANGDQIGLWNIPYLCENVPGSESEEANAYYTAFSKAVDGLSNPNLLIESADHPGCYYRFVNDRIEWLNPPVIPGIEYRTTERWQNAPVYVKLVDVGTLPNKSSKQIQAVTNVGTGTVIDAIMVEKRTADGFTFAHDHQGVSYYAANYGGNISIMLDTTISDTDMSGYTAQVLIRYTKS